VLMTVPVAAVASVCDKDVPATPVTPRLRLDRASAGVTVRTKAVAGENPPSDGLIVYVEVTVSVGAMPYKSETVVVES